MIRLLMAIAVWVTEWCARRTARRESLLHRVNLDTVSEDPDALVLCAYCPPECSGRHRRVLMDWRADNTYRCSVCCLGKGPNPK